MFTGLVSGIGRVKGLERTGDGTRIEIAADGAIDELVPGGSVAVSGVCLTATEVGRGSFAAEVMHETLGRSSLAGIGPGDQVNLELPLRAVDRLGGHVVQGHVDGIGTIAALEPDGFSRRLEVTAPLAVLRYLVPKGSVAVDGVSLTVVEVGAASFSVSLIPETLTRTTLGAATIGAIVNLEVDILAKYVERLVGAGR